MQLILCIGISSIDEAIFRLNESWIVTAWIESLFHFHEALYVLGSGNRVYAHRFGAQLHKKTADFYFAWGILPIADITLLYRYIRYKLCNVSF